MIPYNELREKLQSVATNEREEILAGFIERYDDKAEELGGQLIGFSVSDVVIDDDVVEACVNYLVVNGVRTNEDGDYQDEDGESYDHDELEYVFHLVITSVETRWERL